MVDAVLLEMRDAIGPKVLGIFNVKDKLPPVKFVEGLPDVTAFVYTRKKGEEHIGVDPNYREDYDKMVSLQWGMAEELSHFCHYVRNRDFFMRRIDLAEDESVKDNREQLEMGNLDEFIARMGGLASGVGLPPDFGRTMEVWSKLIRIPKARSKKALARYAEQHPDYAKKVAYASARVWGTGLADCFAGSHQGIRKNIPRYRKILRELTQCYTFDKAADVFERYMPGSKEAKEVRLVKDKLFSN
jgi:hypothetical protein